MSLLNLGRFTNVETYRMGDKHIILYEDHRTIFNVLWLAE